MIAPYHSFERQPQCARTVGGRTPDPERDEHGQDADERERDPLRDEADAPQPLDPVAVAEALQRLRGRSHGGSLPRRLVNDVSVVTDSELVARCRAGDPDAWRELVERYSRYVYAITQAFRLAQHDAEDVFQDTFTRAYERLHTLRDDDAFRPWLASLTRRLCIDRLRSSAREQPMEDPDAGVGEDQIDELTDAFAVHEALAELPRTAARSSTASSPGTRATARSARRSTSPPGRSRAGSRAA
jgi:DNA-directed RNA polymerase specialized sigma24 family protein